VYIIRRSVAHHKILQGRDSLDQLFPFPNWITNQEDQSSSEGSRADNISTWTSIKSKILQIHIVQYKCWDRKIIRKLQNRIHPKFPKSRSTKSTKTPTKKYSLCGFVLKNVAFVREKCNALETRLYGANATGRYIFQNYLAIRAFSSTVLC